MTHTVTPTSSSPDHALSAQALISVVASLGSAVAAPLTAALDRLQTVIDSGRLDRTCLMDLRADIDSARRAGLLGQQIARLCTGQAHLVAEPLNLAALLRQVLDEQAAQAPATRGHTAQLDDIMVLADPSLLATLLRAAADWSAAQAQSAVVWRLGSPSAAGGAVLSCLVPLVPAFSQTSRPALASPLPPAAQHAPQQHPPGAADGPRSAGGLDSLDWWLMLCAAQLAGVQVERDDQPAFSRLQLRLPRAADGPANASTAERHGEHLMAGSQVLVLAAGRDTRQRVREAMHGQDLFIDSVSSVAAARDYCDDGAPQVLIYESAFLGEALRTLCERLGRLQPGVALVELLPAGHDVEVGAIGSAVVTRIGAECLRQQLLPALARLLAPRR